MIQKPRLLKIALAAAVVALFVGHALYFLPFFGDDAFISLRYAKRFAHGLGVTWTDGERVEGYSNLLWVLLNGVTGRLLDDYVLSSRVWGFVGGIAAVLFVSLAPRRPTHISIVRLLTGGMLFALSAPLAVWAVSGLEQSFLAGTVSVALFFLLRALDAEQPPTGDLLLSGLFFGLAGLTRADGILFCAAAGAGMVLSMGFGRKLMKSASLLAVFPALFCGGQLIFRILYYGETVPNTALVKVAFNTVRLLSGLTYFQKSFTAVAVLLVAAAIGVVLQIRRSGPRHRWIIPISMSLSWVVYIISVGGDIFYAGRHVLPACVPLVFLVAEGAAAYRDYFAGHRRIAAIALMLLLVPHTVGQFANAQCRRSTLQPDRDWVPKGVYAGLTLKKAFGDRKPLLAVDAAGALPFWTEFPAVDMLGLTNKYLVRHPPKWFGRGGIGHELGDGAYVLRRRPDFIVFNSAFGSPSPFWLSARQMFPTPEFQQNYLLTKIAVETDGAPMVIYLFARKYSEKIGITQTKDRVHIPGYLFSNASPKGAVLVANNALATQVPKGGTVSVPNIRIPKGVWAVSAQQGEAGASLQIACTCNGGEMAVSAPPRVAGDPPVIRLKESRELNIAVTAPVAGEDSAFLYEVTLKRAPLHTATHVCVPRVEPPRVEPPSASLAPH